VGWWTERVVPRCTERTLSSEPVRELRRQVCAGLAGRVLEIGFGSGLNVPFYPATVRSVDAVEPSDLAWEMSADRRAATRVPIERVGLDGERLAAADATYDAVLCTFTLCTVPDAETAVAEVRRVLRPGGTVHVLEHGLAPDPRVVAWQRRLEPLQERVAGGCHLTREVAQLLAGAGLDLRRLDQAYQPGPGVMKPWGFCSLATAVRP
jgi:SAM-dependent methyltransferase